MFRVRDFPCTKLTFAGQNRKDEDEDEIALYELISQCSDTHILKTRIKQQRNRSGRRYAVPYLT